MAVAEYKVSYRVEGACNNYVQEVEKYSWNVATVMQIMKAESSCNPKAINAKDSHKGCNGSYNLMQVACIHYGKGERKDDIALNIKIAYDVYKRAGYSFRPWTTCGAIKNCL